MKVDILYLDIFLHRCKNSQKREKALIVTVLILHELEFHMIKSKLVHFHIIHLTELPKTIYFVICINCGYFRVFPIRIFWHQFDYRSFDFNFNSPGACTLQLSTADRCQETEIWSYFSFKYFCRSLFALRHKFIAICCQF